MLSRCRRCLPSGQRSIVTAATAYAPQLQQALHAAISETTALHHGFTSNDMPSQAIFLISRSYFPLSLDGTLAQLLRKTVTDAVGEHCQVASAVVDAVGETAGVSMLVASEDEGALLLPFRDQIDRQISLGRAWKDQASQTASEDWQIPADASWKSILSDVSAFEKASTGLALKPHPQMRSAIVVSGTGFSGLDWPSQLLPNARKTGLLASMTPFLTGLPVTMTHEDQMISRGGWALAFPHARAELQVAYPNLHKLGEPLLVTKSQGNILITLNNQPATYCLLEQIKAPSTGAIPKDLLLFGQVQHGGIVDSTTAMIKIISGDPGKGSMALNGGYHVSEGDALQLFRAGEEERLPELPSGTRLVFEKLPVDASETYADAQADPLNAKQETIAGEFRAGSERGLVVGGSGSRQQTWVSEAAHGRVACNL